MTNIQPNDSKHVRFYYLRTADNHPYGCVCTIRTDNGKYFRGTSICNSYMGDQFNKHTGKGIAFSRALKATRCLLEANAPIAFEIITALSEDLDEKLYGIKEAYGLGSSGKDERGFKAPMKLPLSEAMVSLTAREKRMWEDVDPGWSRK